MYVFLQSHVAVLLGQTGSTLGAQQLERGHDACAGVGSLAGHVGRTGGHSSVSAAHLGLNYKNLDFQLTTYGQAGAQMFNRKRALRYSSQNYNFDRAQYEKRWTGPGSTNSNPSAAALLKPWNVSDQKYSSYFVESADYFRIQNITLGYTFRNLKFGNYTMPGLRLSLTADRPFTTFKANAFTPELSDSQGWDTEVYPLTSTYTLGLKIDF